VKRVPTVSPSCRAALFKVTPAYQAASAAAVQRPAKAPSTRAPAESGVGTRIGTGGESGRAPGFRDSSRSCPARSGCVTELSRFQSRTASTEDVTPEEEHPAGDGVFERAKVDGFRDRVG